MIKCQIFVAQNMQWSFRISRGSRIILGPEETYARRAGVRRAVAALAAISRDDNQFTLSTTPLHDACVKCLDDEAVKWANRQRDGYGSKPSPRYRR